MLPENAYIKLVSASNQQSVTLQEVKDLFSYYKSITSKTGEQLGWSYGETAFPYTIEDPDPNSSWFYLKGSDFRTYKYIMVGIDSEKANQSEERTYIQITLPEGSTHGDKGKANEFCKFLAQKLAGELHLFNGRIMYYFKRK